MFKTTFSQPSLSRDSIAVSKIYNRTTAVIKLPILMIQVDSNSAHNAICDWGAKGGQQSPRGAVESRAATDCKQHSFSALVAMHILSVTFSFRFLYAVSKHFCSFALRILYVPSDLQIFGHHFGV